MASWVFQLHSSPVDLKVKYFGVSGFNEVLVLVRNTGDDLRRWAMDTSDLLQHILWLNQLRFIQFVEDILIIPEISRLSQLITHRAATIKRGKCRHIRVYF